MSTVITYEQQQASYAARFPSVPGQIAEISAGADKGNSLDIEAASVIGYNVGPVSLQYVKATQHFRASGDFVAAGTFIELKKVDADRVVASGLAEYATLEEVQAEANKPVNPKAAK
jgi:hypothetical protein